MDKYRFTSRFTPEQVELMRKAAGDAPLTTYIQKATLRDVERKLSLPEGSLSASTEKVLK